LRSSASSRTSNKSAPNQPARPAQTAAEINARSLRHETVFAGMVAALLSVLAFGYCYPRNMLLLYGDAVAHLHTARRLIDSLNPGIRQIGSVWLPFPHLLMMPFAAKMEWWQNGMAGAIPSMACYVLSVAGLWRLSRYWLRPAGAVAATLFFALNPGLLYMQTTAMTEPLFLCQFVWTTLLLTTFLRSIEEGNYRLAGRALAAAGAILFTAILTRYDGWIFACLVWCIAVWGIAKARAPQSEIWKSRVGGAFVLFTASLITAPSLWLAWNARQYGDWLDFMRGPYSAKAIDIRTSPPGSAHYPGWHSLRVAEMYFTKAAALGAAPTHWANLLMGLTVIGTIVAIVKWRRHSILPVLLLWFPVPFYTWSVAYSSVPIHIPIWWPNSWYNTRYGMELLPAFAISLGFLVARLISRAERRWPQHAQLVLLAAIVIILINTFALIRRTPLVLAEAIENSRTRIPFEAAYATALNQLPPQGPILVWTSDHIGAFQRAGIPLRRTINESDYYQWNAALRHPAQSAEWVITSDHDAVEQAVKAHPEGLKLLDIVCSSGQPCVRFYHSSEYVSEK
jgi:hypothetical protein